MDMLKSIFRLAAGITLGLAGALVLYVGVMFVLDKTWSNKPVFTHGQARVVDMTVISATDSAATASSFSSDSLQPIK